MKFKILIIIAFVFLVACQGQSGASSDDALVKEDDVLLVLVDGEPISLPMLEFVMETRGISESDEEAMRNVLDELIRMQAVQNAADASGLTGEPRVRAIRRLRDLEAVRATYLERLIAENPVSEAEIRQLYAAQTERSGRQQYQIETVVYSNQPSVLKDLARLETGEISYGALLTEARDVGRVVDQPLWVDLSQLPPDVGTLLSEAAPGDVINVPLQTPQGWRIVHLVETRDFDPPPLEDVRDGIVQTIRRQRIDAHVEGLYDAAKITPMLPIEDGIEEEVGSSGAE